MGLALSMVPRHRRPRTPAAAEPTTVA
jgi:hypothetical protein